MKKESKITQNVQKAIVNAASKGEDISKKIIDVTRDALKDGLKKAGPRKDKVEKVFAEALNNFSKAVRETRKKISDYRNKVKSMADKSEKGKKTIKDTAQVSLIRVMEAGERAGEITMEAAKGIYLGVKEVVDSQKKKKPVSGKETIKKKVKKSPGNTVKKTAAKKSVKKAAAEKAEK